MKRTAIAKRSKQPNSAGKNNAPSASPPAQQPFFVSSPAADDRVWIGASWYPEMWPEEEWPKDLARMKELGFNIVRVFEFAWHRFEPEEGRYDFAWARRVMDLCHEHGIAVMAGTPTAAPPAWLTHAYPDVLRTDRNGRRATHGRRCHYSPASRTYRRLCVGFVRRMVAALKDHPALHSWQIDNEMSGEDFGPETRRLFQRWLAKRFGRIENLNRTWGLEFWSQAYNSFSQIPLVTPSLGSTEVPERHHPSLILAFTRFLQDEWSGFIRAQCDVIRAASDKPITTNMTGGGLSMNWYQQDRLLDRVGHSVYKDVEHYPWCVPLFDRMRAEKYPAPYWLLETAPSWSAGGRVWNIHHDAAGVRAISWLSTLLGGSMTLFWQWRSHWAGQEMLHGTHVTATGRWAPNKAAWERLAAQYREHSAWLLANPAQPAPLGIVFSPENAFALNIDPTDDKVRYESAWRDEFHLPLVRAHLWRDVIPEEADFAPYRVLLLPLMPMLKKETRARLAAWVRAGGRLVLGPLTGFRSEDFTAFRDQEFGGLEELMGLESSLRFTAHWVEDRVEVQFTSGALSRTRAWCEGFRPTTGAALAHYRGGYGDGHAAVVRNRCGAGSVVTLGCFVDAPAWLGLVQLLTEEAGQTPLAHGSADVVVVPRGPAGGPPRGYGVLNLSERPQEITLPAGGRDRLSGEAAGAALRLAPLQAKLIEL